MLFSAIWQRLTRFPVVRPSLSIRIALIYHYTHIPLYFPVIRPYRQTIIDPCLWTSTPLHTHSRRFPTTHTEPVQTYITLVNRIRPAFYRVYPFLVLFVFRWKVLKCSPRSNPSIPFCRPTFSFAPFSTDTGAVDEFKLLLIRTGNYYTIVGEITFQH